MNAAVVKIQLTIKNKIPTKAKIAFLGRELFSELRQAGLITRQREFFETHEDKPSWVLDVPAAIQAGHEIVDKYGTHIFMSRKTPGKIVINMMGWKETGKIKKVDNINELEAFVASGAFQEW